MKLSLENATDYLYLYIKLKRMIARNVHQRSRDTTTTTTTTTEWKSPPTRWRGDEKQRADRPCSNPAVTFMRSGMGTPTAMLMSLWISCEIIILLHGHTFFFHGRRMGPSVLKSRWKPHSYLMIVVNRFFVCQEKAVMTLLAG